MRAVAALQRGIQPEDDFVEFKAQWPVKSKARQLAGLCNKAAGEVVILIVGIDDKTGAVVNPGSGDVAAWWPGIRGQFDQTPPDLIRQQMVYVGDNEAVYAFAFNTERAPFVVKRGPDNPGFDVPFRDGTTTRSAHRHELISMLLPTVQVPPVSVLTASLHLAWHAAVDASDTAQSQVSARAESISISGSFQVFIEFIGPGHATLPLHGMRVTAQISGATIPLGHSFGMMQTRNVPANQFGIQARHDVILVTGPGAIDGSLQGTLPLDLRATVEGSELVELDFEFDVVGAAYPIRCATTLTNRPVRPPDSPEQAAHYLQIMDWATD